jgi:hypothetical protein
VNFAQTWVAARCYSDGAPLIPSAHFLEIEMNQEKNVAKPAAKTGDKADAALSDSELESVNGGMTSSKPGGGAGATSLPSGSPASGPGSTSSA